MKTKILSASLFAALVLSGCGDKKPAPSADVKPDTTKTEAVKPEEAVVEVDSATAAKAWMDYMTVGDKQNWLASQNGKWSGEMTSWQTPDSPPSKNEMSAEFKMMFNGMYQQSTYKGDFDGMAFEGVSTMAFDNSKKEFQSTWIDNMGSGIMYMTGKMDDATKTITMEGVGVDPTTGKDVKMREVLKFPDENTQSMEMFCEKNGKEQKNMEITMTRKK